MSRIKGFMLVAAFAGLVLFPPKGEAGTTIYLRYGPPSLKTVRVVKPPKPFAGAVWVSGHWAFKHGRYVWVKGRWTKPRPGYIYVPARWKKTPRGYRFVPGRWVKK